MSAEPIRDEAAAAVNRAQQMREEFDRLFAQPLPGAPPPSDDLLAIRVAGEPYALRLPEIGGLFADRKITPLPSRMSGLLGLAGFRGAVVPVYDLHALLGYPPAETVRWLVTAANAPLAFAFTLQEGHFRLSREAIVPQAGGRVHRHVREFAGGGEFLRPIVHLPSVVEAVRRQLPAAIQPEPSTRRAFDMRER